MDLEKLKKRKKITAICYITTRILVVIILGFAIYQMVVENNYEYDSRNAFIAIQSVLFLAYSFIPMIIEKRWRVEIPESMEILFIIFCIGSLLIGEIVGFYRINSWWDGVMHFMSGSLIAIFSFSLTNLLNKNIKIYQILNPFFMVLFAFCFALTLAVIWEIIEFTIDSITQSDMQRYKDSLTGVPFIGQEALRDTMYDFILGGLGALIVCIIEFFNLKYAKRVDLMIEPLGKDNNSKDNPS